MPNVGDTLLSITAVIRPIAPGFPDRYTLTVRYTITYLTRSGGTYEIGKKTYATSIYGAFLDVAEVVQDYATNAASITVQYLNK